MFKKKLLSVLLAGAMVISMLPSNITVNETKAAATWRSALYPENWTPGYTNSQGQFLHDFSYAGYEKGEKEIPTEMAGLYADVTQYGADSTGAADSTAAIQSAIDAVEAAGGGTVYLPAGTYKVKPSSNEYSAALTITGSNILFKGAGVGQTFIRCYAENMRYCQVINVSNGGSWDSAEDGNTYYLSQDVPSTPTTTIHLNSVGSLKAGDWVIIRSDRTQSWIDEHSMGGFWYASVNPTTMGTTFYRQITSVNTANNTIEIDIPTRYYMKTRDNARVYKVTPKQSNVGLMDFSIGNKANSNTTGWGEEDYKTSGNGSYSVNNAFLIKFSLNVNCFAKNISTYAAGNSNGYHMSSNGLDINKTRNLTVENCDFSNPQYEGGGGNGYGMNICGQETLIKDCSSTSARHSFAFKYSYANGNVVYHYTSTDPKYGSDFHMYLSMSNLIDNEELNGDFVESNIRPYGGTAGNRHGYTSSQTVFWNTKGNYYKSGTSYIIDSRQYGYGYIIGTQGAATAVKTTPTSMSSTYGTVDTAPEDYTEGIGTGDSLYPQSLYYDQLEKRLSNSYGNVEPKDVPGTFNATEYSSKTSEIVVNTSASGVNYVGNLVAGSSLEYKINAAQSGNYKLTVNAVSGNDNQARTLSVYSGSTLLTTLNVVNMTDWEAFQALTAEINLPTAGEQTLKIVSSGSVNIADITFEKIGESEAATQAPTTDTSNVINIPGTVAVSNYASKTDTITINTTGSTTYAGNLSSGAQLDYYVNVTEIGIYKVNLKLAAGDAQYNAANILVKIDDTTAATVPIQTSTGWETFVDHTASISFVKPGQYKLSLVANGGGGACNIADFSITEAEDEVATLPPQTTSGAGNRVVGYLPSYRSYTIDSIDYSALTHLCLSFMTYANGTMTPTFSASDVQKVVQYCHNNGVKVLIAIGGGGGFNTSDGPFNTASQRTNIVNQIMDYVNQYNLDGVDIDIEVTDSNVWANFDAFCAEMSSRLKAQNKLYTMAVSSWFTGSIQNSTYDYFDFVNLMTYDENFGNGPVASMSMVTNMISHYSSKGISDDRMVIGVPFYGYGSGSTAYTYAEILALNSNNRYADYDSTNGIYYNGENTIKEKAELSKSYGGTMIWELGQDSFDDRSLLQVIKNVMATGNTVEDPTITDVPGTIPVGSYVSKTSGISITTTGSTTYAGNLNDGSYLDYYINVPEKGTYTVTLKLAAGDAQYNASSMYVKLNDATVATVPVQASTGWEAFVDHTTEITFPAKGQYKLSVAAVSGACNVTDIVVAKAATEEVTTEAPTEAPTTTAAAVTGQCDLVVTDIYTDKTYYAGEEAQFVVKVKNQGTAATPSGIKHGLLLYVNGTAVNWCDTYFDSMGPGAEATLVMNYGPNNKATWTVPSAGTYTVQAWIDDQSLITESNEDNNRLEKSITFTDKPAETTTAPQVEEPSEVFGLEVTAIDYNTISVVWGSNSDKEAKGQLYNVYIDGVKKLSNVTVASYKFEDISAGTHTVKVTAVLNGTETAGATATVTVEDEPVVSSDVSVEINGYQISTTVEGFRTVYSINDPNSEVVSAGMLYGIGNVAESSMVYGASGVYNFGATDAGKLDATFSSYAGAQSYSMTMQFAKSASFYTTKMNVRAYAKLSDGTYVYSGVESFTVYDIADFLYQNLLMNNLDGHDYLYNNILSVVDSTYKEKDFAWNNSIVNPDVIM